MSRCEYCGEEELIDVFEYWPETRDFMLETCCEESYEPWVEAMREWTPEQWQAFFLEKTGIPVRSVGGAIAHRDDPADGFKVDLGITIVPSTSLGDRLDGKAPIGALTRAEVKEFIRLHHDHAEDPPAGWFWGYAVYNGPPSDPVYEGTPRTTGRSNEAPVGLVQWPATLVGVVMVGKVSACETFKAARSSGEKIAEVSRVAMNHGLASFLTYKAQSAIYERVVEDAGARGFDRCQTFTLESESGMSLRYARWKQVGVSRDKRRRRRGVRAADPLAQTKIRWSKSCKKGAVA